MFPLINTAKFQGTVWCKIKPTATLVAWLCFIVLEKTTENPKAEMETLRWSSAARLAFVQRQIVAITQHMGQGKRKHTSPKTSDNLMTVRHTN